MSDEKNKPESLEQKFERMERTLSRLTPLADMVDEVTKEEGGMDAGSVSGRARLWGEHQGNVLGADMVNFYQHNAPKFAESVSRTVATFANSFHGMMNADAIINGTKYNWIKTLIVIAVPAAFLYLVFANPANSGSFSAWLGRGVNAYVLLIFVIAGLLLVYLITQRRKPEPVR